MVAEMRKRKVCGPTQGRSAAAGPDVIRLHLEHPISR